MANSDLAEVWARSLDGLADLQIQPHQRAWLKLTRPLGLVENTALIATPNEFVKEQLETRLRALVTQALSQQLGRDIQLAVTVDPAPQAAMPGVRAGPGPDPGRAGAARRPVCREWGCRDWPEGRPPRPTTARGLPARMRTRRTTAGCTAGCRVACRAPASTPARTRAVPEDPGRCRPPRGSAAPG